MSGKIDVVGQNKSEKWIPLLDYAVMKGISTSTLRRYIKAQKIQYKVENGKYFLLAPGDEGLEKQPALRAPSMDVFNRVQELELQLLQAKEQISELKMLVALYEEKISQTDH